MGGWAVSPFHNVVFGSMIANLASAVTSSAPVESGSR